MIREDKMDYTVLHMELTTDPKAVGYAPYLTATNDLMVANLMNSPTGSGAALMQMDYLSHDAFASMLAPAVMALGSATTALQTKWSPMLTLVSGISTVYLSTTTMWMLSQLQADGLITATQLTSGTTRVFSRAEVLFGMNTAIQWQDVAKAMGRG